MLTGGPCSARRSNFRGARRRNWWRTASMCLHVLSRLVAKPGQVHELIRSLIDRRSTRLAGGSRRIPFLDLAHRLPRGVGQEGGYRVLAGRLPIERAIAVNYLLPVLIQVQLDLVAAGPSPVDRRPDPGFVPPELRDPALLEIRESRRTIDGEASVWS